MNETDATKKIEEDRNDSSKKSLKELLKDVVPDNLITERKKLIEKREKVGSQIDRSL